MIANEYQKLALRTAGAKCDDLIINCALGLSGESGEVADMVKKHFFQGHDLDRIALAKELGDVAWYLAVMAHCIDMNLSDVLEMNIEKLKDRYPDGFSSEKSINRGEYNEPKQGTTESRQQKNSL